MTIALADNSAGQPMNGLVVLAMIGVVLLALAARYCFQRAAEQRLDDAFEGIAPDTQPLDAFFDSPDDWHSDAYSDRVRTARNRALQVVPQRGHGSRRELQHS